MQLLIARHTSLLIGKGDIVEIRGSNTPFGGNEPNAFVIAEIPEPMAQFEQYGNKRWEKELDFSIVNQDTAQDAYRVRLFSTLANSQNTGQLERENVEAFINEWGGVVFSNAINEVVFDISITAALQSQAFWRSDLVDVLITESSYNETTGDHQIQFDYSAKNKNPTAVERHIVNFGGEIVSHANRVLVANFTRADVRARFLDDIKRRTKEGTLVSRYRYYVNPAVVDAIDAQGGIVQTDLATVQTYIRDKVAD
jgi:hypothetical protein